MNKSGAIAGMIVGALTVIIWKQLSGGIFEVYELLPGFIFAFIAIILISKATLRVSIKSEKDFDDVQKLLTQDKK